VGFAGKWWELHKHFRHLSLSSPEILQKSNLRILAILGHFFADGLRKMGAEKIPFFAPYLQNCSCNFRQINQAQITPPVFRRIRPCISGKGLAPGVFFLKEISFLQAVCLFLPVVRSFSQPR